MTSPTPTHPTTRTRREGAGNEGARPMSEPQYRRGDIADVEGRRAVYMPTRWEWMDGTWTTIPMSAPIVLGNVYDIPAPASTPSAREGELAEVLARVLHDEIGGCCLERIDACVFGGADVKHEAERVAEFLTAAGFGPVAEVEAERVRLLDLAGDRFKDRERYRVRAESAEAALAALRAGIEALADGYEQTYAPQGELWPAGVVANLRALLATEASA